MSCYVFKSATFPTEQRYTQNAILGSFIKMYHIQYNYHELVNNNPFRISIRVHFKFPF